MPQSDNRERLIRANCLAEKEIASIKNNPKADKNVLERHLKNYTAYKLLLCDVEVEDTINEAIRESVARSLNVEKERLEKIDQPGGCDGLTAVLSKRVLLFMSIQKELGIKFPPEITAHIKTFDDLSGIVQDLLVNINYAE